MPQYAKEVLIRICEAYLEIPDGTFRQILEKIRLYHVKTLKTQSVYCLKKRKRLLTTECEFCDNLVKEIKDKVVCKLTIPPAIIASCPKCGSKKMHYDRLEKETVCTNCGTVRRKDTILDL